MKENCYFITGSSDMMYFSEHESESLHGVAFLVSYKYTASVISYNSVNSRGISIELNTRPIRFNTMEIYTPIIVASDEKVDLLKNCWECL